MVYFWCEPQVGKGKIVVCGFDLTDAAGVDPVSRQMRRSLLDYMDSKQFQPRARVNAEVISNLIRDDAAE